MRTDWHTGFALGAVVAAALLAACPGRIDDPDTFIGEVDCIAVTTQLLEASCSTSGCHDAVTAAGNLNLRLDDVGAELLDRPGSATCGGLLISSSAPEESLMYTKMTAAPTCGDRMPLFARAAQNFEIECMLEWVRAQQIGPP